MDKNQGEGRIEVSNAVINILKRGYANWLSARTEDD